MIKDATFFAKSQKLILLSCNQSVQDISHPQTSPTQVHHCDNSNNDGSIDHVSTPIPPFGGSQQHTIL